MINDLAFMAELKRLPAGARFLTSLCAGSLVLGAAGLLKGKRAACHWARRDMLPLFGTSRTPGGSCATAMSSRAAGSRRALTLL